MPDKFLRLEAGRMKDRIFMKVTHQKDRAEEFNHGWGTYTAKNGINITSTDSPRFRKSTLHVRGSDESKDKDLIKIPDMESLEMVRKAVSEFNNCLEDRKVEIIE